MMFPSDPQVCKSHVFCCRLSCSVPIPHACTGLTSSSKQGIPTLSSCAFWSSIRDVMNITELPVVYSQIELCNVWNILLWIQRLEANVSFSMSQQNHPQSNLLSTCTCLWQLLTHCSTQWKISLSQSDSIDPVWILQVSALRQINKSLPFVGIHQNVFDRFFPAPNSSNPRWHIHLSHERAINVLY